MYSKFLQKNKALLKESRSFRNSRSLARRKRKVFEAEDSLKKAWENFKDSYSNPYLADAVLDALDGSLADLNQIYDGRYDFSRVTTRDMKKFFIENEDDILEVVYNLGASDIYQEIGETLITNGLYAACEFLCNIAASDVANSFFENTDSDELEDDSGLADKDFLRENSDSEIKNQIKKIIRIIDNSMDDWSNHQEEMSYEGGEEEQDFIDGVRDIKYDLEDMLDADEDKMKSIAKRIRDTLNDMEEKDAGMRQNFKYNTYYNDAKDAEYKFWKKITDLVDKLDSDD